MVSALPSTTSAPAFVAELPTSVSFDIVKIDRSFVREVDVDEHAAALAESVIGIAKALKLTSLAEGVETFGQADWLTKAGCDAAQGYFFARPMPPVELLPALTNGLPLPPGPPPG